MSEIPKPKYRWALTYPGENDHIFSCYDGARMMGRVAMHHDGKTWHWNMTFCGFFKNVGRLGPINGYWMPNARAAALECEACYDAIMAGTFKGLMPGEVEQVLADEAAHLAR